MGVGFPYEFFKITESMLMGGLPVILPREILTNELNLSRAVFQKNLKDLKMEHKSPLLTLVSVVLQIFKVNFAQSFFFWKTAIYSGPSILRPPMGPRKCGLILQVVLK